MSVEDKYKSMSYGPATESREQADAWLVKHDKSFSHFIDGVWSMGEGDGHFASNAPCDRSHLADVMQGSSATVDAAVSAAKKAQPKWQKLSGHQRAKYLYALARLIQKNSRVISVIESLDNGKSIRESRDIDIPLAARHFYHHAGWAQLSDETMKDHVPHGVVGQIIPWNFPFLMMAWKIAPALAAGNTAVLKPAEFTSLSALYFAELVMEAGLPAGVVNIITGDGATGAALVDHKDVSKLAFTGSTEVGRKIRRATAGSGKALTLELGGKSPFIIFDDADLDSAVEGLVDAIWFNQGQVCCAGSRLLVQESIEAEVIEKIKARMSKLRIGTSLDKCIDMSALVDDSQRETIEKLVKQGAAEGATVWQPDTKLPQGGVYYPPTLITDAETTNICVREEIFGPVLTTISFRTQKEAVELANNTLYGLAASVWSENINRALEVAPQIKAGVVWVNGTNMFDAAVGFGGMKESGFGREGGMEGMYAYLKPAYSVKTAMEKPLAEITPSGASHPSASVDKTAKNYVGGKQARPDGGDSYKIYDPKGALVGLAGLGNRKDIRNAVEAAASAVKWPAASTHTRAQILYYIAENLSYREGEFVERIRVLTGASKASAAQEFELSISRLFSAAAWCDKYDGRVHTPPLRGVALAMNEPIGVIGIACPESKPLLAMISLMAPAIAMGNRVIILPSERAALLATDLYQVFETSDLPAGVVNVVTGPKDALSLDLAAHSGVDALWYFGGQDTSAAIEVKAADNMKRTWVSYGRVWDCTDDAQASGEAMMRRATEVKNIWIPYGDQT